MSDGFTKIYREERELLKKINNGAAYEVYMHLKDKYNYFKQDVYDYIGFIAEHLEMSERTIIRTIKKLKEVGLIESKRVWAYTNGQPKSINIYSFPIVDKIEEKIADDTEAQQTIESAIEGEEMGKTGILQDNELIGTIKSEQFEVMKGKIAIEIEEQDLTNEEIIKRASNDFVNHYKIDSYNLWVELNDRHRNGESYQILWKKWVDMWRPYICTDRRIELQAEITSAVVKRYSKRYFKELKERQSDTTTVTKSNTDPQNTVLNDNFDNYSEDLNAVLDEHSKVINNAVTRIVRAQMFQTKESEYIIDQAIKKIDGICATLKDDKDKLDFEKYINERMDSITDDLKNATEDNE